MLLRTTTLRTLFLLIATSAITALAGCYTGDGELVDDRWTDELSEYDEGADNYVADDGDAGADLVEIDERYDLLETEHLSEAIEPSHGTGESEAKGLIDAPDEVAVFVGETLEVDVYVTDPSLGSLLPAALPEHAVFEPMATGGRVRWQPRLKDIGSHDFVFLIVDADEPSLVVAQQTMSVEVLPRFSLVEYGF